jgi:MFS family permease
VSLLPKSPRLRRILVAYTVNELGTWFGYVALALGVYDHTHSAIATAGLFIARGLLPALFAPLLVARAEHSPRRSRLTVLLLAEGLTTLALAFFLWHFLLVGVLVLVAVDGILAVTTTALIRATAARTALVGDTEREPSGEVAQADRPSDEAAQRQANAALNFAFMATFAVGPAIGALLVHLVGGPTTLLLDALTFPVAGLLVLGVRTHVEAEGEHSIRDRLAAAWRHMQLAPQLRTLLLTEAVAIVFLAAVEPVEVLYAKTTLAAGDLGYGLLVTSWGIGAAAGAVVFARATSRPLAPMLTGGVFLLALAYLGYAAAPSLRFACGAAFVGGVGNGIHWPSLLSAVQKLTPTELQGRLMSAVGSIEALCPAIGFALGGLVAAAASPRVAMLMAGLVSMALTVTFVRISLSESVQPGIWQDRSASG